MTQQTTEYTIFLSRGLIYLTFTIMTAPRLIQPLLIQRGKSEGKPLPIDATLDIELTQGG